MAQSCPPVTMVACTRLNCRHLSSPPCARRTALRKSATRTLPLLPERRFGTRGRGRLRPQSLQRFGGVAARLGVIDQNVLPIRVRHREAASVQKKLAELRVTHGDDACVVANICASPQLTEALARRCQLID